MAKNYSKLNEEYMTMMANTNDDEKPIKHASHQRHGSHHHVEIATLSMPSAAAEIGVQSGEGTKFILEASTHIIDQLVESENDQNQHQKQPCIEGVIDLEVVSHLVKGMTDDEFVGLLHRDVGHAHCQHEHEDTDQAAEPEKDEEVGNKLLRQSSASQAVAVGEHQPLLQNSSNGAADPTMAFLSLSADPFIQTLSGVHREDHSKDLSPGEEKEGGDLTLETIGATNASENSFRPLRASGFRPSFLRGSHAFTDAAPATVSREAFLLSVPTNEGGSNHGGVGEGNMESEDAFVLALPGMVGFPKEEEVDKPFKMSGNGVGSTLRTSAATVAETVADMAMEMDHVFAPLPTDVQNVELRVSTMTDELHLDLVIDRKVPLIGYMILVSGLFALSSIGAALELQKGEVTVEMKILWRLTSTALLFSWLAAKSFNRKEFAKFTWMQLWIEMPFAAANYAFLNTAFAVALDMTSMVNAFVLSNMASLVLIGAKFVMGVPVLFYEGLGALTGLIGALICAAAPSGDDIDHRALQYDSVEEIDIGRREMMGNIMAFLCSVAMALYLTVAKKMRAQVDLFLFMFLIFFLSSAFMLLYIMTCSGQEYEFSFHPEIGVFGWVNRRADRLPLELFIAIICNGVGTTGYIAIMKYFDPVVVTMVMLLEPIIATFIGKAVGVSTLPGIITWAGDAVVMAGSIMVIWSGSKKTETVDATDALQKFDDDLAKSSNFMKSPLMKSPRLMKSPLLGEIQHESDEMDFVSVRRNPTTGGKVKWPSMQT